MVELGIGSVGRDKADDYVALIERGEVLVFVGALDYNHRIAVFAEDVINQQAGHATVAVFKGVDADVTIVEERSQLDG